MNVFQRFMNALSGIAPDVFQSEVAAGLGYSVVIFNLHLDDTKKAAFIGAAVLLFTLAQAAIRVAQPKQTAALQTFAAASAGK